MKRFASVAVVAALVVSLSARPARASGHVIAPSVGSIYGIAFLVILAAVAPSEYGALLPAHGDANSATFDLGWTWQIPLPIGGGSVPECHHRIVVGLDYFPTGADTHTNGRGGYRYDRRHLFVGLAAGWDHDDFIWSPEVGVKLVNFADPKADFSPSLHLLVRANFAPEVNALRSVTVLLGWSVF